MRLRGIVIISIVATVVLSGCATHEIDARPTETNAHPTDSATPGHVAAQPALATLNETAAMSNKVGSNTALALGRCLARRGHPQMVSALTNGAIRQPDVPRPALGIHPLELGPTSATESAKYGMTGVGLAFSGVPAPNVVSKNKKYDEASAACLSSELSGSQELAQARQEWSKVLNEARRSLVKRTEPGNRRILEARLSCVRKSGYPKLIGSRFLEGDLPEELERIGV